VAGTDQSVWAFRVDDGKFLWRYRCQQPLTDNPTLIDDTLYQTERGKGLIAIDTNTGSSRWVCSDVLGGEVITRTHDGELIVWDRDDASNATGSTFYRVNERTGRVSGSFHAAKIYTAIADRQENGTIYGLSRSGRLIKLLPQR
jgi:outer membrane protein assembly factor BamB